MKSSFVPVVDRGLVPKNGGEDIARSVVFARFIFLTIYTHEEEEPEVVTICPPVDADWGDAEDYKITETIRGTPTEEKREKCFGVSIHLKYKEVE